MTIVSTSNSVPLTELEKECGFVEAAPLRSYPPVDDAINFIKGIDWSDLGSRIRVGTGNLLLFAMKFSEKSYDFHEYLYTRLNGMK